MGFRRLKQALLPAVFALVTSLAPFASARAENRPAVVELFTSQGCSSCPPADEIAAQLARWPNMIVLSLPVDYWDYIGWKDTLASPAFTARQKNYAATRGDGHVYTPQVVVDGLLHVVGSDKAEINGATKAAFGMFGAMNVPLKIDVSDNRLGVTVGAASGDMPRNAQVWLLRVAKSRTVAVGRGENAGRTITYTNVVRAMTPVGYWTGHELTLDLPRPDLAAVEADGFVILVQAGADARPGAILAAAKGPGL